jgi:inorganic pyrophosphatase
MTIEVLIEIPKGSRNKYELDKASGRIKLDRVLETSVAYPADYGLIQNTEADDGDPLDVLVITRFPTFPGCLLAARPIALVEMIDSGDNDEKIVAVPKDDRYFDHWRDIDDIPEPLKKEIAYFFSTYKELEEGKHVEVKGWQGAAAAEAMIKKSMKTKEQYENE